MTKIIAAMFLALALVVIGGCGDLFRHFSRGRRYVLLIRSRLLMIAARRPGLTKSMPPYNQVTGVNSSGVEFQLSSEASMSF